MEHFDITLEIFRTVVVGLILVIMLMRREIRGYRGWGYIIAGFYLIFFGMLIDITDNFPSLNPYIIIGDTECEAFLEKLVGYLIGYILLAVGFRQWIPAVIELEKTRNQLQKAMDEVKVLSGLLPICASCKKIREDNGKWTAIERYIQIHSKAEFSHSICQECARKLYPDIDLKVLNPANREEDNEI